MRIERDGDWGSASDAVHKTCEAWALQQLGGGKAAAGALIPLKSASLTATREYDAASWLDILDKASLLLFYCLHLWLKKKKINVNLNLKSLRRNNKNSKLYFKQARRLAPAPAAAAAAPADDD